MKKPLFVLLIANMLLSLPVVVLAYAEEYPDQELLVKLSPEQGYVDISHMGRSIRIIRDQDPTNLLDKDYSRTSRPCPPFCIQPIKSS